MKLKKYTNAEILKSLELLSNKDVRLTPANKAFFIALYNYVRENGTYDESKERFFIQLSSYDFSKVLNFPHTTTTISLNNLNKCNAIERIRSNGFKKISNTEFDTNKPYLTYINSQFLENKF